MFPLFKRKSQAVEQVLPERNLHGRAQGNFEWALRGLLEERAPLSAPRSRAQETKKGSGGLSLAFTVRNSKILSPMLFPGLLRRRAS